MKKSVLDKIKNEPALFLSLADKDKSIEVCEFAVTENGLWLSEVPENQRTESIILKAITNESHALQFVNFDCLRDSFIDNIVMLAISYTPSTLQYVPCQYQTPRMVANACERLPMALEHVAHHLKSPELCKHCLDRDVKVVKFVPVEQLNNELVDNALKRSPWAIGDVPAIYLTQDRLKKVVAKSGQVLKVIPSSRHSEDLYVLAFRQDPMSICHMVNEDLRNRVVATEIAKDWPFDYEHEPQNSVQAEKFLSSERAKHQPHLALAYRAYLSEQSPSVATPKKVCASDEGLGF